VNSAIRAPAPSPGLSRALLAVMALTVIVGLPVDKLGGLPGQLVVSLWTWCVFFVLLARINQQLRLPLMACLVIATAGECILSLAWSLYVYRLHNIPLFVPPGHVLLFALGLTFAPRMPAWALPLIASAAAGYGVTTLVIDLDTISAPLAALFVICMIFGSNRRLYATMFLVSLMMELYGTWIGNWAWTLWVPGTPFISANPPLCVGALYCLLDLSVVNTDRWLRKWRDRSAMRTLQAGSAA
jgi:hypothetical protein